MFQSHCLLQSRRSWKGYEFFFLKKNVNVVTSWTPDWTNTENNRRSPFGTLTLRRFLCDRRLGANACDALPFGSNDCSLIVVGSSTNFGTAEASSSRIQCRGTFVHASNSSHQIWRGPSVLKACEGWNFWIRKKKSWIWWNRMTLPQLQGRIFIVRRLFRLISQRNCHGPWPVVCKFLFTWSLGEKATVTHGPWLIHVFPQKHLIDRCHHYRK